MTTENEITPQVTTGHRFSPEIGEWLKAMFQARQSYKELKRSKTGRTGNQTFQYAPIGAVDDAIKEAFEKHGLMDIAVADADGHTVTSHVYIFHVQSGQWGCASVPIETNGDPKEIGKGLTYSWRYGLIELSGIKPEDDDAPDARQKAPAASRSATPQSATAPGEVAVTELTTIKTGTNAKGEWSLVKVHFSDGNAYATLDKDTIAMAASAMDNGEAVTYTTIAGNNPKFRNLGSISIVRVKPEPSAPPAEQDLSEAFGDFDGKPSTITPQQAKRLTDAVVAAGRDVEDFKAELRARGWDKTTDIPASEYGAILAPIEKAAQEIKPS